MDQITILYECALKVNDILIENSVLGGSEVNGFPVHFPKLFKIYEQG
jgi:hypothetical protein